MSAYDNLKCVSIGTEKKMGFERDEFIERTEKQKNVALHWRSF